MSRLNASQLAAFTEIVRTGSFDGAARKLHVTSSAISQRVRQLEDGLGQVLIVRETPCRPTPAGQELLRHALQVELLEKELFGQMGLEADGDAPPVSLPVAVNADSLDGWFVDVVEAVCSASRLVLDIRVEDQDHSAQLLRTGDVVAAIGAAASAPQGCSAEYIGSMRYLALAAPAYCERYFATGVNAVTLAAAPRLVYNHKDDMQDAFVEQVTGRPIDAPHHFVPSTPAYVQIACRGLGWGMIPQHLAAQHIAAGALVELRPGAHCDVKLYFHRWQVQSRALGFLAACVHTAARKHLAFLAEEAGAEAGRRS
jgi:LysR family transcriptional regulator (chromosome initiation inhibitor)